MVQKIALITFLIFVASAISNASDENIHDDLSEEYYMMGNTCAFLSACMLPMTRTTQTSFQKIVVYSQFTLFTIGAGWAWYKGEQYAHKAKHPDENRCNAVLCTISGLGLGCFMSKVAKIK